MVAIGCGGEMFLLLERKVNQKKSGHPLSGIVRTISQTGLLGIEPIFDAFLERL